MHQELGLRANFSVNIAPNGRSFSDMASDFRGSSAASQQDMFQIAAT